MIELTHSKEANPEVALAIDMLGGDSAVARMLGVRPWAISKWRKALPLDRVLWLAAQTEWRKTPHQLCPALYPHPDDGLPAEKRRAPGHHQQAA